MASIVTWQAFLERSLATRLEADTFSEYVSILNDKHPLPAPSIADIFLRPREENTVGLDPRIVTYVQILLVLGFVTPRNILKGLWQYSSFRSVSNATQLKPDGTENVEAKGNEDDKEKRWTNSYASEETLFYRLTKAISSNSSSAPSSIQEAIELVSICTRWMALVLAANSASVHQILELPGGNAHAAEKGAQNMALGTLLVAVVENSMVTQAIAKGRVLPNMRKNFKETLAAFIPLISQNSPQSAARLEGFLTVTMVGLEPVEKKGEKERQADREIEDILDESLGLGGVEGIVVEEIGFVNSRAGLYIYLNSLLVGRPLIDDHAIFAYLHNRYQGDIRSTIVDLVLAAFDILANATFRNEKAQTTTLLRSFLINKVPVLLTALSSQLFPPLTSEYCITEALSQVDTTTFPTLSNMFDDSNTNNMFSDSVRQDFCFACCLHGLIEEDSIEGLLGDVPMQSLPAGGKYVKEVLVQQCLSDPARAEGMIDELEHMDGNVGAVSQAITEVIARLCQNKETMSLKTLCSQLAKKPSSLDVMLLFAKPTTILQPICDLLDNWSYDEDQGEYQPVYEEFGSILLLVLSFTHRYGLSAPSLGLRTPSSFMSRLLTSGHLSRALDDLTTTEQAHLDGWIRGLFDTEAGGLQDDLMSSCPPQDFYLLIPTLFHHICLACSTKHLSDENLKAGLEYLVDTFLLPSLIPGITWLSAHLWESRGDANAVLQILSALITKDSGMSNNSEASSMLNSILNIVAKNLEHSLRWLQRAEPQRQDVEPLSRSLRGNLGWERRGASEHTELEGWTSSPGGGMAVALKGAISGLVQWGLNPTLNSHPASYTHRQLIVACKIMGAKRVLGVLVEETKNQCELGNAATVYDVVSAIICAPDAPTFDAASQMDGGLPLQRRLNLREALRNEVENAPKLRKTDQFTADTLIRLFRKVDAQLVMPQTLQLEHHDLSVGLEDPHLGAALNEAAIAVGMDGEGSLGLGGGLDGMDGDMGMGGMEGDDLMHGLLGSGSGGDDDLMGAFDGGMGDGMGF